MIGAKPTFGTDCRQLTDLSTCGEELTPSRSDWFPGKMDFRPFKVSKRGNRNVNSRSICRFQAGGGNRMSQEFRKIEREPSAEITRAEEGPGDCTGNYLKGRRCWSFANIYIAVNPATRQRSISLTRRRTSPSLPPVFAGSDIQFAPQCRQQSTTSPPRCPPWLVVTTPT
jgi:hypothetical protein